MGRLWKELVDSLWKRNALFVIVLGNCSALVVSTSMAKHFDSLRSCNSERNPSRSMTRR
jgi:Na+-transporting NADH:ubiquinone oxidoreductase subunit NqrD